MAALNNLDPIGILLYDNPSGKYYFINGAGQFEEFVLPQASQNGYYTYIVSVSQEGTSAPVVTDILNNTGLTFVWTYQSAGKYRITPSTSGLCTISNYSLTSAGGVNEEGTDSSVIVATPATNYILLTTYSLINQEPVDAHLYNNNIEIKFISVS